MKKMRNQLLIMLLMVTIPAVTFAQERGNRTDFEQRMKEQNEALKKDLKLDKKQTADFDKATEKYNKARQEMMAQGTAGDREANREKMMKLRDDYDKELKGILSDKQYKKLQEIQAERRQQMGQRGGQRGQGAGGR